MNIRVIITTRYPPANVFDVGKNQYTLLTHYTPDLTRFISKEPIKIVNDKLEGLLTLIIAASTFLGSPLRS